MSFFPLFIDLSNKDILVIGGGNVAYRKILTLLKFTQNVTVIAPIVIDDIKSLKIEIHERNFNFTDLSNRFLVITATNDKLLNQKVLEVCQSRNILCNSATSTQLDNCIFPSIVKNGNITIGISTNGKNPSVSKKIREDIEKNLPLDDYNSSITNEKR